jgi:hypothetical protein
MSEAEIAGCRHQRGASSGQRVAFWATAGCDAGDSAAPPANGKMQSLERQRDQGPPTPVMLHEVPCGYPLATIARLATQTAPLCGGYNGAPVNTANILRYCTQRRRRNPRGWPCRGPCLTAQCKHVTATTSRPFDRGGQLGLGVQSHEDRPHNRLLAHPHCVRAALVRSNPGSFIHGS